MIRLICPGCGSKLNAKDELVGQTRKCPKCARPVVIVADAGGEGDKSPVSERPARGSEETGPAPSSLAATNERMPTPETPERLNRESHYLICDRAQLVATWENNGSGWMVKSGGGFLSAKRSRDTLPGQGDFKLVELKFTITPDGKRLAGLTTYQLAAHWALTVLAQGDDVIVEKITGYGFLNREQKNAVRQALRDQFMRQVWSDAAAIVEYLGNTDYHSHSVP
jgi:hypothetical protein